MRNNNQGVPQAREAMDQFKMQAANEVGVNLKQGVGSNLTSREAGDLGGQMAGKMWPKRTTKYARYNRTAPAYRITYQVIISL